MQEMCLRIPVYLVIEIVYRKSFDELINARRFHTMIYLEENMYEDREIAEYITDNAFQRF